MGLFAKFKAGLQKTHSKLAHEIKRIVTRSPKLDAAALEELEASLIAADLGMAMTSQIIGAVKQAYETQGSAGMDVFGVARREVERSLASNQGGLRKAPEGLTVVSIVGVNGTGKTTTAAKLAHLVQSRGETTLLAACDTFRAAAINEASNSSIAAASSLGDRVTMRLISCASLLCVFCRPALNLANNPIGFET